MFTPNFLDNLYVFDNKEFLKASKKRVQNQGMVLFAWLRPKLEKVPAWAMLAGVCSMKSL